MYLNDEITIFGHKINQHWTPINSKHKLIKSLQALSDIYMIKDPSHSTYMYVWVRGTSFLCYTQVIDVTQKYCYIFTIFSK